jgi:hypothetical protein
MAKLAKINEKTLKLKVKKWFKGERVKK